MEKRQLYVSFEPQEYKQNKANLLNAQMELLNIVRHLQKFKQIKNHKAKLKQDLHSFFLEVKEDLESLEQNLPTPAVPKTVKKYSEDATPIYIEAQIEQKNRTIESELREIQGKLRELKNN